jgi:hypothetical protein
MDAGESMKVACAALGGLQPDQIQLTDAARQLAKSLRSTSDGVSGADRSHRDRQIAAPCGGGHHGRHDARSNLCR